MGNISSEYLPHYTYDEYCLWEGNWELMAGTAVAMSPAPTINHQTIAYAIARELGDDLDNCEKCLVLGETDYKITDDTVLRPDVALICEKTNANFIARAPEIIVEVISKSTASRDENYKFKLYEAEKVKYYILVYPDTCLAKVYKLIGDHYSKEGDFSYETYDFDGLTCHVTVNFTSVFKKVR